MGKKCQNPNCENETDNQKFCSDKCKLEVLNKGIQGIMEISSVKNFLLTREHLSNNIAQLEEKYAEMEKEHEDMKTEIPLFKDQPFTHRFDSMMGLQKQMLQIQESIIDLFDNLLQDIAKDSDVQE